MEQFISIQNLSTIGGLILVVVLLVQYFKEIVDNIFKKAFGKTLPTKYLTFIISEFLLFTSKYFLGENICDGEVIFINFINGVILASVAMKSVETLMNNSKNNGIGNDRNISDDTVETK